MLARDEFKARVNGMIPGPAARGISPNAKQRRQEVLDHDAAQRKHIAELKKLIRELKAVPGGKR